MSEISKASVCEALHPEFEEVMNSNIVELSLKNHPWTYRGEGNANIVISLSQENKVLRLRKTDDEKPVDEPTVWLQMKLEVKFINFVMKAILGEIFVKTPSLVMLTANDIKMLNSELALKRPANRCHKWLSFPGAQLCEDFTLIPSVNSSSHSSSFCFELKPKQGIHSASQPRFGKCKFCLKQQLKVNEGLSSHKSQYCPLDLFSGVQTRMVSAIKALLQTPQNNLKVFCDGNLIYGQGFSLDELQKSLAGWIEPVPGVTFEEQISSLIVSTLTKEIDSQGSPTPSDDGIWIWDGFPVYNQKEQIMAGNDSFTTVTTGPMYNCNWVHHELPKGCVLHHLASAQALDQFGLDYTLKNLSQYLSARLNKYSDRGSSSEKINYVNEILEKRCSSKLEPVEAYLLAATARDCSVLITLQKILDGAMGDSEFLPEVEEKSSKVKFRFKVFFADIDPKPISCISAHVLKRDACLEANRSK